MQNNVQAGQRTRNRKDTVLIMEAQGKEIIPKVKMIPADAL